MESTDRRSTGTFPCLGVGLAICGVLFLGLVGLGAVTFTLRQRAMESAERRMIEAERAAHEEAERARQLAAEEAARKASDEQASSHPTGPTKTLRLAGPPTAKDAELAECVAILNRRFQKAKIPGSAELGKDHRIEIVLSADPENLRRAGTLLAAGGHLQFKEVLRLSDEDAKKETDRLAELKARSAYDEAKEKYDALPSETEENRLRIVVNAGGVEGHYVASASPRKVQNGWVIDFTLNPEGQDRFFEFTTRLLEKQFAVILDGTIKMIFTSKGAIRERGMMFRNPNPFSEEEALRLTALMSSGRLPLDLTLEED